MRELKTQPPATLFVTIALVPEVYAGSSTKAIGKFLNVEVSAVMWAIKELVSAVETSQVLTTGDEQVARCPGWPLYIVIFVFEAAEFVFQHFNVPDLFGPVVLNGDVRKHPTA